MKCTLFSSEKNTIKKAPLDFLIYTSSFHLLQKLNLVLELKRFTHILLERSTGCILGEDYLKLQ